MRHEDTLYKEFTTTDEIYKMFTLSIKDYSLKDLFQNNINVAQDMMEMFLKKAIGEFTNCIKPLENVNFITGNFGCHLDYTEQKIIVKLMIYEWANRITNDITQMNWSLNDNDFKHFSEERNLAGKANYVNGLREQYSQDMINYGLSHTPYKDWAVGNYGL